MIQAFVKYVQHQPRSIVISTCVQYYQTSGKFYLLPRKSEIKKTNEYVIQKNIRVIIWLSLIHHYSIDYSDVHENGDNTPLNIKKKSQPLILNGRVPKGRIDTDTFMKFPETRRQEDNAILSRASLNNVYSNALQNAATLSLEASEKALEPMKVGEPSISGSRSVSCVFIGKNSKYH